MPARKEKYNKQKISGNENYILIVSLFAVKVHNYSTALVNIWNELGLPGSMFLKILNVHFGHKAISTSLWSKSWHFVIIICRNTSNCNQLQKCHSKVEPEASMAFYPWFSFDHRWSRDTLFLFSIRAELQQGQYMYMQ